MNCAERIRKLAAEGATLALIAHRLHISKDTFRKWLDNDPALAEAIEVGRAAAEKQLFDKLWTAAMNGNIVAAIYLSKARFGWREGDQGDAANKVSITFSLPGALKPEEFARVVEHEPANTNLPVPATRTSGS